MKLKTFSLVLLFCFSSFGFQLSVSKCYGEKLPVVVSIYPVADMVKQVGGEYVDVTTIIPSGASPHTFSPKPSQVKKISSARIFFMIGAGLETWAGKFVKSSGNHILEIVLSEGVSLIHNTEKHHHNNVEVTDSEHDAANPHIWLDPVIAKKMTQKIVWSLSVIDRENVEYYERRGRAYTKDIENLNRLILDTVNKFKLKKFVSFHPAWVYFARRYGLESVGVIESAPGRNPTPRMIMKIVAQIKKYRIRAVFAEPQLNPKVAEVIAKEADAKILLLDPLGGPGIRGRSTYIDLMKYNLNILQEAML